MDVTWSLLICGDTLLRREEEVTWGMSLHSDLWPDWETITPEPLKSTKM